MTARSVSDLAADVREELKTLPTMHALAELVARLEAAEAQVAALTQERNMARASRGDWERQAKGRGVVQHELLARAEAAEAALAGMEVIAEDWKRQFNEAQAALADTRRALEQILGPSPTRTTTTDQAPEWVRSIARRALAAADGGLTAPPMDLGGLVDDAEVANKIDRRAATGGGQEQQP